MLIQVSEGSGYSEAAFAEYFTYLFHDKASETVPNEDKWPISL